jgi:hypothetical protein
MPSVFEDEIDSFVDIFTSSDAVKVISEIVLLHSFVAIFCSSVH